MAREPRKKPVVRGSLPAVVFSPQTSSTLPNHSTASRRSSFAKPLSRSRTSYASGSNLSPTSGSLWPSLKRQAHQQTSTSTNDSSRSLPAQKWPPKIGRPSRLSYSRDKSVRDSKSMIRKPSSSTVLPGKSLHEEPNEIVKSEIVEQQLALVESLENLENAVDRKSSQISIAVSELTVDSKPSLYDGLQSLSSSNSSMDQVPVRQAWPNETKTKTESRTAINETTFEMPSVMQASSDSEWDTDIEEDFKVEKTTYDATAKDVYVDKCKSVALTPASFMCRNMGETSVAMRHHGLGPDGGKSLAEAIAKNAFIECLDLTDNYLEAEGGLAFANMLFENCILKELDLSQNFLRSRGGTAFAQVLKVNQTLKVLALRSNHLVDLDAKAFAEMMKVNSTLQRLDLSHNNFGVYGGIYLGAGLSVNSGLVVLDLSFNSITLRGSVAIATALKKNTTLEVLRLSWNGFSLLGCMALADALRLNQTLLELDLSNNRIPDEGARKLAKALTKNRSLEILKIGRNPIGMEAVEELVKGVMANQSLRVLGLEDLKISAKTMKEINELHKLRGLLVEHGRLTFYEKVAEPNTGIDLVVKFVEEHRYRLIDLFFQFDKDKSGEVTCREFKRGLKESGLGMTDEQLNEMIDMLDVDGNGRINYSELCSGRQEVILEKRRRVKSLRKKAALDRERMRLPSAFFKFDVTGK